MPYRQSRDLEGRKTGRNAATPVFDPSLSPGSTDAEAGGQPAAPRAAEEPPARLTPDGGSGGVRLPLPVWYGAAVLVLLVLGVAALMS